MLPALVKNFTTSHMVDFLQGCSQTFGPPNKKLSSASSQRNPKPSPVNFENKWSSGHNTAFKDVRCHKCNNLGHYTSNCSSRKPPAKGVHFVDTEDKSNYFSSKKSLKE